MWPKTIVNAGYAPANDPRTGSAIGGFNQLSTIDPKHNRRSYSAREYYEPNKDRANLFVLTHALVSKVELEKNADSVKATGVQFTYHGSSFSVKAKREVIVCGGAVNSPQILELSGIGSPAVLQKAGVEVIVDLPSVGENLSDHTATGIVLVSTTGSLSLCPLSFTETAIRTAPTNIFNRVSKTNTPLLKLS